LGHAGALATASQVNIPNGPVVAQVEAQKKNQQVSTQSQKGLIVCEVCGQACKTSLGLRSHI
jgi:transcription elongation factor Elf1